MIIVTGAAGFIGSNLVKALNRRGEQDIIAVDNLSKADKFHNLIDCDISDYIDKQDFLARLATGEFDHADAIFHQGACSDTMGADGRYMLENNYRYSLALLDFCQGLEIPFFYASSASVYGLGKQGFSEERRCESPLNVYAYSKFLFDQIVRQRWENRTAPIVGLRYFNVYGNREQHKGRMASVAFHQFHQYQNTGKVQLFAGCEGFADGAQSRDFISVEDVVKVNMWFLDHPECDGIFNLGTGKAQPFNDIALATVNACRRHAGDHQPLSLDELRAQGLLSYIPFPDALLGKYQSFTQADMQALREIGYTANFLSVEQGVSRYVDALIARTTF